MRFWDWEFDDTPSTDLLIWDAEMLVYRVREMTKCMDSLPCTPCLAVLFLDSWTR